MSELTTYDQKARQTSTAERSVTVVLMIGLALLVPIASFLGLMFAMVSDGCMGDTACNADQIGLGVAVASVSPVLVFLAALVVVIKRFASRRPAWWVPLVALAVGIALWVVGAVIAAAAVG